MRLAGGWAGAKAATPDFELLVVALRLAQSATPTARAGVGLGPREPRSVPADRLLGRAPGTARPCRFSTVPEQGRGW